MSQAFVIPAIDPTVRELCHRRYQGHPKGCPNYGKRSTCPPQAPMISDMIDLGQPIRIVWNRFDLGAHITRMRARHSDWSHRQCACCLYWQGTARKQLKNEIRKCLITLGRSAAFARVVTCPEACGVNVTATMASIGVTLEWPPVKWAYQVALVGYSKRRIGRVPTKQSREG